MPEPSTPPSAPQAQNVQLRDAPQPASANVAGATVVTVPGSAVTVTEYQLSTAAAAALDPGVSELGEAK